MVAMTGTELRELAREVHVLQQRFAIWGEGEHAVEASLLLQRVERALCRVARPEEQQGARICMGGCGRPAEPSLCRSCREDDEAAAAFYEDEREARP